MREAEVRERAFAMPRSGELIRRGIRVNTVSRGPIATPINRADRLARIPNETECAQAGHHVRDCECHHL